MVAPRTYREFWPYYVGEHRHAGTRWLHFAGTAGVLVFALVGGVTGNGWWLVAMPILGYAFAWLGHAAVERNKPATFRFPVWSLIADFQMFGLMCLGRMESEVARCAGVTGGERV
jgi:hypothetical protein